MKKTNFLILAFVAILIIACSTPEKEVKENPYEGAWEITYLKYVYPDTTIETTQFDNPDVKLLTKSHYAFGHQVGENQIVGGGGEYTYDGDTFTSYPKYHYFPGMVGNSLVFNSKIEGNLWTIAIVYKNDTVQVDATETWKRIIE
ncbi:MAG: hypothetical protein KAI99_17355 [Cyclobacteriaceae bacterium]|nr:hypothetical protein [Cyclobacteriaceae bacterium]